MGGGGGRTCCCCRAPTIASSSFRSLRTARGGEGGQGGAGRARGMRGSPVAKASCAASRARCEQGGHKKRVQKIKASMASKHGGKARQESTVGRTGRRSRTGCSHSRCSHRRLLHAVRKQGACWDSGGRAVWLGGAREGGGGTEAGKDKHCDKACPVLPSSAVESHWVVFLVGKLRGAGGERLMSWRRVGYWENAVGEASGSGESSAGALQVG